MLGGLITLVREGNMALSDSGKDGKAKEILILFHSGSG